MDDPNKSKGYLNTPEAARQLKISYRTLEKYRCKGIGPVFFKIGGRVIYAEEDIAAWMAASSRRCTRDPGPTPPRGKSAARKSPVTEPSAPGAPAPESPVAGSPGNEPAPPGAPSGG